MNNWCGCNFSDLFDNKYNVTNFNLKFIDDYVLQTCTLLVHELQISHKPNKMINNLVLQKSSVLNLFQNEPNLLYHGNSLHSSLTPDTVAGIVNELKISNNVRSRIGNLTVRGYYGIHIRGTDFPQKAFISIAQLENEIMTHPQKRYFICSDQKDIEESFTKKFSNAIALNKTSYVNKLDKNQGWNGRITDELNRSLNYNVNRDKVSVIEAFCDMFLLSETKLVKTSNSSFLMCAHVLSKRNCSMNPLNGDTHLQTIVKKLVETHKIETIVETGTHLGSSTGFFSDLVKRVITTEINEKWQIAARTRLHDKSNIRFILGDSATTLGTILPSLGDEKVLFFLDSHFNNDKSLDRELKIIEESKVCPYILIHDFKVPNRPDLGYDSWDGQEYCFESFQTMLASIYRVRKCKGYKYMYNSDSAYGQRGCLIVSPVFMKDIPELTPFSQ